MAGGEAVSVSPGEFITINFHGKIDPLEVPTNGNDELTCEIVLQKCMLYVKNKIRASDKDKQLNKYLRTFGLVCPDESIWIPLNHVFKKSSEIPRIYKFRVRFLPPGHNFNDSIMCEYLLFQLLEDFLVGNLGKSFSKDEKLESRTLFGLLEIALLFPTTLPHDNTALVDEKFKTRSFNIFNFTNCFSKEIRRRFITQLIIDHYWVYKAIKSRIHEFKVHKPPAPLGYYSKEFCRILMETVPDYYFERYNAMISLSEKEKENTTVTLGHFTGCNSQLALFYGQQLQCNLEDIYDMSLRKPKDLSNKKWSVEINVKTGPPKILEFEEEMAAESFVTMIQGYFNLCVRYDTFFCKELQTASSKISTELKSFGPLGQHTVESYFEDSNSITESSKGVFLINESLSHFGQYDVYCSQGNTNNGLSGIRQARRIQKTGTIVYLGGTQLRLKLDIETTFENSLALRRDLIDKFGQQLYPVKFARIADINEDFQIEIESYGTETRFEDSHNKISIALPVVKEDLTEIKPIPDKNPLIRKYEVYFQTEKMMLVELQSENGAYAKSFREGLMKLYKLNCIKPSSFLKFYSLVVDAQFSVLMEYAPHQDVLTFVCDNPQTVAQKVNIMDQIITILSVMDKAKFFHGNLRLRKFMTFDSQDPSFVTIKLGDPGISSYFDTCPFECPENVERSPWLSPQRRKHLEEITCESEVYAVGTTLCELLYRNDQFHEELKLGSKQTILEYLNEKKHLPCPPFLADNCQGSTSVDLEGNALSPEAREVFEMVWDIILRCWTEEMTDRPTVPDLLNLMKEVKEKTEDIEGDTIFEKMKILLYDGFGAKKEDLEKSDFEELKRKFNACFKEKYLVDDCINMRDYKDEIGSGHFGTVWKGQIQTPKLVLQKGIGNHRELQQKASSDLPITVAVKKIKTKCGVNLKSVYNEVITFCNLDHPNIVKCLYLGNCFKTTILEKEQYLPLMMIMEYLNLGNLSNYANKKEDLSTPELVAHMLKIMLDVAEGMVYLSGKSIIHRDLAARNVLLSKGDDGVVTAKVSDFGLARITGDDYRFYRIRKSSDALPFYWMPPECLVIDDKTKFTSKADVWSFGIVLWEGFSKGNTPPKTFALKKSPLEQPAQLLALYKNGTRLPKNNFMHPAVYDFMKLCWDEEPNKRPQFVEVVQKLKKLRDEILSRSLNSA